MRKIHFSIDIDAPATVVWKTLWEDSCYRAWTAVFSEGSHAVTDWQEGSKVLFLDGKGNGMHSTIKTCIPNVQMSIKHIGCVKDGAELPPDEVGAAWSGAMEEYFLTAASTEKTLLEVIMDSDDAFENYFQTTFPKALATVKAIAEK